MKRAAALLLVLPLACHFRLWHDPPYFPPEPQHVPLSVEWQWPVQVYSGGSPAPMPVTDLKAACIPADACNWCSSTCRRIRGSPISPRLSVIGTHTGPAKVEITYTHPKRQTQMTAKVDFVFEPAEQQLHVLAVGDAEPVTPFIYTYGSDQLRCDVWVKPEYNCFVREARSLYVRGLRLWRQLRCGVFTLVLGIDAGRIKSTELSDRSGRGVVLQRHALAHELDARGLDGAARADPTRARLDRRPRRDRRARA